MICNFIREQKEYFSIKKMCQILNISRSNFYKNINKKPSKRKSHTDDILEKIKIIHKENKKRYGSPRVHEALKRKGIFIGVNKVAKVMRNNGIFAKRKKKFRITTDSKHKHPVSPNLVNRQFNPKSKNTIWVSDITYIWTDEDWLFLCIIKDLYNQKIVGWSTSSSLCTDMVIASLNMAVGRENPPPGLIFHSDRGVQYACGEFRKILKNNKMIQSMSRKGNCWDNAPAESFFNTIKTELICTKKYKLKKDAEADIFEYIESYYNRLRFHSSLGYKTPKEFDEESVA